MGDAPVVEEAPVSEGSDLNFYFRLVRPLIVNLRNGKERALASAWAKKIMDEASGTEKLRTDYIKLLLMALQRNHLVGIFADDPEKYETLESFPEHLDVNEFARNLIEKEFSERRERIRRQVQGDVGSDTPYITDCSMDSREYVAVQNVPGFGVHCYYAISKDPVNKWQRTDRIPPKRTRSKIEVKFRASTEAPCVCAPEGEKEEESECRKRMQVEEPARKRRRTKLGATPLIAPLGTVPSKDDRLPPKWGTNLMDVKDKPDKNVTEKNPDDDILALESNLSNIEQFLEQYQLGRLATITPKSLTPTSKNKKVEVREEYEDEEDDQERMVRQQEINADSYLVEYLKGQLNKAATQFQIAGRSIQVQAATPARAFIPVTTPKTSPIPRRPISKRKTSRGTSCEANTAYFSQFNNQNSDDEKVGRQLTNWFTRLNELEEECELQIVNLCGASCKK